MRAQPLDELLRQESVEPYEAARHYWLLCQWWRQHGQLAEQPQYMPPMGVLAHEDGQPAAACFLGRIEGTKVATLMHLVANPELPRRHQSRGVHAAVGACVDAARREGMEIVYAETVKRYCVNGARRHGFRLIGPLWLIGVKL